MFGACYKQPLKPSGSEPPAEECRMTPRHAGCDVTEMQRILSQPTFTEHLLRAVCLVNGKGSLSRPQESILGSLARKNLRRIHRVSKASYFYIEGCTLTDQTMLSDVCQTSEPKQSHHIPCDLHVYIQMA
eukprot:XP_011538850.1 HERV-H LTR-associating protein 3 isoform X2 [Homo sapiens]